jgi:hypothetical protein
MCKEISDRRDEPPADADPPPAAVPADVCQSKSGAPDERERIQPRVEGFNCKKSRAWLHLSFISGPKLNQAELISIADVCSQKFQIKLDREHDGGRPSSSCGSLSTGARSTRSCA